MTIRLPKQALRTTILTAACAAIVTGCAPYEMADQGYAYGAAQAGTSTARFDQLDLNRDGFLSRAELEPAGVRAPVGVATDNVTPAFHRLDANGDGFLSPAEAQSVIAAVPGGSFAASDVDRDGFLNLAEATPHLRWLERRQAPAGISFEALDRNRDGFVSRAEAEPLLGGGAVAAGGYAYPGAQTFSFERLDLNRDGFLTRTEAAPAVNAAAFDQYDSNRDGYLARAEADALLRSGVGASGGESSGTVHGPRY